MASAEIPPALVRNVAGKWGDDGVRWLAGLPALIGEIAAGWELTVGAPYELSMNWVAAVTRADGTAAVLKLGVPGGGHLRREARALRAYRGRGAVRLLAEDAGRGALLLERAEPGDRLAALVPADDSAATATLIAVGRRLHVPPPPGRMFPELRAEGAAFGEHLARFPGDEPVPRHLVVRAGALFGELCDSAPDPVLLHGDLHHDNVLRGTREPWLAIDPFGLAGDPGFDCGAMLYNPDPCRREAALVDLVPRRIGQLAGGFGLPVERVVAWGFVMAVLSQVWTAQGDPSAGTRALDVATRLYPRLDPG